MSEAKRRKTDAGADGAAADGTAEDHTLQSGFGNELSSEAMPGALPLGRNNPQRCAYKLYAEQLSGTAFTLPRAKNQRSWLYRLQPGAVHGPFVKIDSGRLVSDWSGQEINPNQLRWAPQSPLPAPGADGERVDFVQGLATLAGCGDPTLKSGLAIHLFNVNAAMSSTNKALVNSDGDLLIVPQSGPVRVTTEFGVLDVAPRQIAVVQRGMRFAVDVSAPCSGYVLELYEGHLELPNLGPIGSNGLANPRDFLHPTAAFQDIHGLDFKLVNKFGGQLFEAAMDHSPFDVVAWHGNYVPYKYDLERFCCMNSVTYDHPDPSIYTVLTAPSNEPGMAVCDFVIFPPRWMVMEQTFRPPWYHRNCMTEFMGMIYGSYDAKEGFRAGGASLHSCMTAHGPDAATFEKASSADLQPTKFDGGLAFMFETCYMLKLTPYALEADFLDRDYQECWAGCASHFDGTP